MKRTINVLCLALAVASAQAQNFATLHNFTSYFPDGANPYAGLLASGGVLYGTTVGGGGPSPSSGNGTVFQLNTDGKGFTGLHGFTYGDGSPYGGLILSAGRLFGTSAGCSGGCKGTVFSLDTDGSGFTTLHTFAGYPNEGSIPIGGLISSGVTLYGTTTGGGISNAGTVFAINTDGSAFATLHHFIVSDGGGPQAGLILSGNTLYGTARYGGSSGLGTVFSLSTDGTGFTNLHHFTGSDGSRPYAALALSGNTLFGTTRMGGTSNLGTVFALNTDGSGFINLHHFTGSDGSTPQGNLIVLGSTLYGTTEQGGCFSSGTIFALNTDGSGFTNLHHFAGCCSDGANPHDGLVLAGNILYGTADVGGAMNYGTVFSLSLPPPGLSITRSGANVILAWPANAANFSLQTAPTLTDIFTNLPGATSPYTNPVTGAQQFFRLIAN